MSHTFEDEHSYVVELEANIVRYVETAEFLKIFID